MPIRDARPEDHALFCRFHDELGVRDPAPDAAWWAPHLAAGAFFVEEGGEAVAFAAAFPREDAGHVLHVIVAPAHRGRGLGRVLLDEAARRLRAAGCRRWYLNVIEGNAPALALYRRYGMRTAHVAVSLRFEDDVVEALAGARGVEVAELSDAEARAAEERYGLCAGATNRPPGIGVGAWRALSMRGATRFVASTARSAPFKVDDAGVVRPLLDGMRARLPAGSAVKIVLEGQEEIAGWLVKHGAIEELRLLHLAGELPA
jgi:ribosomal protein S18 acetylase RimI-like enzyme